MEQEIHENQNQLLEISDKLGKTLTLDSDDEIEVIEIDEDDFEFSFDGGEIKSPVSAEDVFHNGQIRPTIPFPLTNMIKSDETLSVRKVFVVSENEDVVEGPYCVWSTEESESSSENQSIMPEMSKKSNSTGFSRLRKMKELLVRSNSDGKDTFIFLTGIRDKDKKNKKNATVESSENEVSDVSAEKKEKKKGKKPSMTSAYEALYGGKKEKKKGGEKSYLPYRVGFFTNVNSMTKNVHPY